jgi:hypothetical protein
MGQVKMIFPTDARSSRANFQAIFDFNSSPDQLKVVFLPYIQSRNVGHGNLIFIASDPFDLISGGNITLRISIGECDNVAEPIDIPDSHPSIFAKTADSAHFCTANPELEPIDFPNRTHLLSHCRKRMLSKTSDEGACMFL